MKGMRLGMGVGSNGLMNPLEDRFHMLRQGSFLGRRILGELSLGRLVFVKV